MTKTNGRKNGSESQISLERYANKAHNSIMQTAPQISKAAFLARFNERARRFAVDCEYKYDGERWLLIIEFDDGTKEPFRGFALAA